VIPWCGWGCEKSGAVFKQPLRVVEVETGKKDARGQPEVLLLDCYSADLPIYLLHEIESGEGLRTDRYFLHSFLHTCLACRRKSFVF
jgi:hypothetical protein